MRILQNFAGLLLNIWIFAYSSCGLIGSFLNELMPLLLGILYEKRLFLPQKRLLILFTFDDQGYL
jgi:hypothetical protein